MAADTQTLVVGSTYRFSLTATLDGVAWNITGGTITLYLQAPDGTTTECAATIVSGAGGTAKYDCSTSDLSAAGQWRRSWRVSAGGVVQESLPIHFAVVASPGG